MLSTQRLPIGVEIDLDLSAPLSPDETAEFRRHFFDDSLILARNQRLTPERHAELCALLGPVPQPDDRDAEPVHRIDVDGRLGAAELVFHSDLAFDPEPFVGVSLHALAIEPEGGSGTQFVSGIDAYRDLDPSLRDRLEGLSARHVFPQSTATRSVGDAPEDFPSTVRPVVWTHPETGQPILYVSEQATSGITELSPDESTELLEALFAHLYRPEAIFEHRWRTGDVLFWDNRALQHARGPQVSVRRRLLQRVIIGRGTVGQLYGDFLATYAASIAGVAHSAVQPKEYS